MNQRFARPPEGLVAGSGGSRRERMINHGGLQFLRAGLRKWPDGVATALAVAAEKALKAEAAKVKKLLASWTAAETAQAAAGTANSQHDASQRVPLRTAVNAGRRELHADLTKLAVESFFRKGRGPKPAAVA